MLDLDRALERFDGYVIVCPVTGCWHWQGGISRGGQKRKDGGPARQLPYGTFWVIRGLVLRAHIFIAWAFGIIPGPRVPWGCELDHTCENSLCVSPWHIELVDKDVNQDYRHGRRERRRPTWGELYALRGVSPDHGEAVEPRHLKEM